MSRFRSIPFLVCLALPLGIPAAVRAQDPSICVPQVEYAEANPNTLPYGEDFVQSFTPQNSFRLKTAEVLLEHCCLALSQVTTLYLQDGPDPGATILRWKTFDNVLGLNWHTVDLDDIDLFAGTTYYLRIHVEAGWWPTQSPGGYADGAAYQDGVEQDSDHCFRLCGEDLAGNCAREVSAYRNPDYDFDISVDPNVVAQSFTPPSSMRLTAITVYLDAGFPCTANLYLQDEPYASSNVYRQASHIVSDGAKGWITFDVDDLDLVAGKKYFIRVAGCDSHIQVLSWKYGPGSLYSDGEAYENGSPSFGGGDLYFRICASLNVVTAAETPSLTLTPFLVPPRPNPTASFSGIEYRIPRKEQHVRMGVYDAQGRLVRHLLDGPKGAGDYTERWDLRNDAGRSVGSGVYYVKLQTTNFEESKAVVVVR